MTGKTAFLFCLAIFALVLIFGTVLSPFGAPGFNAFKIVADLSLQNSWAGSTRGAYPPPPLYLPLIMKGQSLGESSESPVSEVGQGGETVEPKN